MAQPRLPDRDAGKLLPGYLFAVKWLKFSDVKQQPLGCKGIGLQTFALDRMLSVSITSLRCKLLKDFDADEFFKPYFGVFCPAGEQPKRIVVHASESDAHYIRTLPIHHTQKELEHNVFEVTLVPALDFEIYMRRYLTTTWEVQNEERRTQNLSNHLNPES